MNYYVPEYLGAGRAHSSHTVYSDVVKRFLYSPVFKNYIGTGTSDDAGIQMDDIGANIVVDNNKIYGGMRGIVNYAYNVSSPVEGLTISNNMIGVNNSTGITCNESLWDAKYYGNTLYDNNINIRFHNLNHATDKGRKVYIYNNSFWNPAGTGMHFFAWKWDAKPGPTPGYQYAYYYIYHNTFTGGRNFIAVNDAVRSEGGMPNTHMMNNVSSCDIGWEHNHLKLIENKRFGYHRYNWHGGSLTTYAIDTYCNSGEANSCNKGSRLWDPSASSYPDPLDYSYAGKPAFVSNEGINLGQPFAPNNNQVLPGMAEAYAGGLIPLGIIR